MRELNNLQNSNNHIVTKKKYINTQRIGQEP